MPSIAQQQTKLQQAVALHRNGALEQAQAIYHEILAMQPRHFDALHLLGVIAAQTRDPQRAVELIGKALEINPNSAAALCNRAAALHELGHLEQALANYDRAIALKPDYTEAHFKRGKLLHQTGQLDAALAAYERAVALKADYGAAHFHRGLVLHALGQLDAALGAYDRAAALATDDAEVHSWRGDVLWQLDRLDAALQSYDRAIEIDPAYAQAHSNRGIVLRKLEMLDAALESFDRAIALKPDYAEAHFNRGVVLRELRRLDEALESFGRAIALRADYAEAYCHRSYVRLLKGDFANGWLDHEWRWLDKYGSNIHERRNFPQPLWLGKENIAGKTILLHSEQGLGDTLQFCRYAKLVAALGARVILEVPRPLLNLLVDLEGVSQLVVKGTALPPFDYQCPLMSLPLAFNTDLDTIPAEVPYLRADRSKVAQWQARLGERIKPRIGLVWSGNPRNRNDRNRSIPLAELMPHLPAAHQYVSLQKDVREPDRQTLQANVQLLDFAAELHDLGDTAALCECMDLVISVDTLLAHLSGALGKRTWVLLPFDADWRWLTAPTDCPWYPTARLYRQARIGEWRGALERLEADLTRLR